MTEPGLTDEDHKIIEKLATGELTTRELAADGVPANSEDGNGANWRLSKTVCERMRRLSEKGMGSWTLADQFGLASSTVHYHVSGQCTHREIQRVGPRRCNVIREMARDGIGYAEIADTLTGVSRGMARYHAVGECACDNGIPPVATRHDWTGETEADA